MKRGFSKRVLLTFLAVLILGAGLHFLYDLLPNPLTALLSPVRESLWEHVKIIFWPGLAAALFLRKEPAGGPGMLCALLLSCAFMLGAGWVYHVLLGGHAMAFDLVLYALCTALVFFLPLLFPSPLPPAWAAAAGAAAVLVCLGLAWFTFRPLPLSLFADLSR